MATTTSLSADLRARLETTRRILGLSQAELSNMAGISQGNVSNCLQGRNVRVDSVRRLLSAFASGVAGAGERGVSPDQVKDLQIAVEAARRAIDGNVETRPYLARPGAPMPENAANRIERLEDRKLVQALDDAPFTAAVVGPPECGKSTLLGLLAAEAQRRGFTVVEFDARLLPVEEHDEANGLAAEELGYPDHRPDQQSAGGRDPEGRIAEFFGALAEEIALALSVDVPDEKIETRLHLSRFLKQVRLRRPAPPLLIIVDHASVIDVAIEDLAQVCRSLDAQKGRTQMSWAIEASVFSEHRRLGVLSRLGASPLVHLGWLRLEEEVEKLAASYDLGQHREVVEQIWEWFEGQPFLTHTAFSRVREVCGVEGTPEDRAWKKVVAQIESCEEEFKQHISRLKTIVSAAVRTDSEWQGIFSDDGESFETFEQEWTNSPTFRDLVTGYGIVKSSQIASADLDACITKFYRAHLFKQ
jgi:transcriptional regulator with XRE-family HTH domain